MQKDVAWGKKKRLLGRRGNNDLCERKASILSLQQGVDTWNSKGKGGQGEIRSKAWVIPGGTQKERVNTLCISK